PTERPGVAGARGSADRGGDPDGPVVRNFDADAVRRPLVPARRAALRRLPADTAGCAAEARQLEPAHLVVLRQCGGPADRRGDPRRADLAGQLGTGDRPLSQQPADRPRLPGLRAPALPATGDRYRAAVPTRGGGARRMDQLWRSIECGGPDWRGARRLRPGVGESDAARGEGGWLGKSSPER